MFALGAAEVPPCSLDMALHVPDCSPFSDKVTATQSLGGIPDARHACKMAERRLSDRGQGGRGDYRRCLRFFASSHFNACTGS